MLETHLIDKFWDMPVSENRENNDHGGTGRPRSDTGVFYVYVLILRADLRPFDIWKIPTRPYPSDFPFRRPSITNPSLPLPYPTDPTVLP